MLKVCAIQRCAQRPIACLVWSILVLPLLNLVSGTLSAAEWTGAANSGNWETAGNWANRLPPGAGDAVIIDGAAVVELKTAANLGSIFLRHGATLRVAGKAARLTVAGGGRILDSNLVATDGATISIGALNVLEHEAATASEIRAEGSGSVIALPLVTAIAGGPGSPAMQLTAKAGGKLQLPAITSLNDGAADLNVTDVVSAIELPKLSRLSGVAVRVSDGGAFVQLPALVAMSGVSLTVKNGATLKAAALTTLSGAASAGQSTSVVVDGARAWFLADALLNLRGGDRGGALRIEAYRGGYISFGSLQRVGAGSVSIVAEGGATIDLPLLSQWLSVSPDCSLIARQAASLNVASPILVRGVTVSGVRVGDQGPWPRTMAATSNLVVFGTSSAAYAVGYRTNTFDQSWRLLDRVMLDGEMGRVDGGRDVSPDFVLRASPVVQDPPLLRISGDKRRPQLSLIGKPSSRYVVEAAPALGGPLAPFAPVASVETTNSIASVTLDAGAPRTGFFRVRESPRYREASKGNRLTYLDGGEFYSPNVQFAALTTEQWVGDRTTEAVVILSTDDLRTDYYKFEGVIRPLLDRLRPLSGRSPFSIFCISPEARAPELQRWIGEGVTMEAHTITHPCPILGGPGFEFARTNFLGSLDLMSSIPQNRVTCIRVPCCDSVNSASPRFFDEILPRASASGVFAAADASVMQVFSAEDRSLPRALVYDADGVDRFRKYLPDPLATYVENYPYPYQIGRLAWELPVTVPSDYEAQYINGPTNVVTLADWKAGLDATVLKRGLYNLVFHAKGWTSPLDLVAFADHIASYGPRVRVLTCRDVVDRLNHNVLGGESLRTPAGTDNGVRLMDVNNDGYMDVTIANDRIRRTRIWQPETGSWRLIPFPVPLVRAVDGRPDPAIRFGIVGARQQVCVLSLGDGAPGAWVFDGTSWVANSDLLTGLTIAGQPVRSAINGIDRGVRLRDIDGDGQTELIVSNPDQSAVFAWDKANRRWNLSPYLLPDDARIVDSDGNDAGTRFADIDSDGFEDIVISDATHVAVYLFTPSSGKGWTRKSRSLQRSLGSAGLADAAEGQAFEVESFPSDCACQDEGSSGTAASISDSDGGAFLRQMAKRGEGRAGLNGPRPAGSQLAAIPPFVRKSGPRSNGVWFKDGWLYVQNEDTALYRNYVSRTNLRDLYLP